MTRPPDRVEMLPGVVHLPAEFREVARLANLAGRDGFEVADLEIGMDVEADLKGERHVYLTISYKEKPDATEKES